MFKKQDAIKYIPSFTNGYRQIAAVMLSIQAVNDFNSRVGKVYLYSRPDQFFS